MVQKYIEHLNEKFAETDSYYYVENQVVNGPWDPEKIINYPGYTDFETNAARFLMNKLCYTTRDGFGYWYLSENNKVSNKTYWSQLYPHNLGEHLNDVMKFKTSLMLLGIFEEGEN